jgi:hypothetical protein
VQVWEGASLVELDTDIHGALRVAGGKRGKISGFSPASRRRLLRKLAKTRCDCLPHFVTLTYPDRFPRDAQRWKRDLDALLKRLRRLFPASAGVWKLEVKERQSGGSAGAIAPQFPRAALGRSGELGGSKRATTALAIHAPVPPLR